MNNTAANQSIKVMEIRNYLLKPGQRDNFISFFENNFIDSQNVLGGYVIGQYRIKGADDNFLWLRGFNDMASRSKYLPAFYRGAYWKARRNTANDMITNNDNVYLVKPLSLSEEHQDTVISSNEFGKNKGLAVIDFYIANTRLNELTAFFRSKYVAFLKANSVTDMILWTSELTENDFPGLPVFRDKNLLVMIAFYKDEDEYQKKTKLINAETNQKIQTELREIVTTRNTVILYPTKNSFSINTIK